MTFDFRRTARALRSAAGLRPARRSDDALTFVITSDPSQSPTRLLLDTCVYIDRMQDKLPSAVIEFLMKGAVNHSSVAVQELLFGVGLLDPSDGRSAAVTGAVETVLQGMPPHRLFAPDLDVLTNAAIYAGILARTQSYAKDDRRRAMNDCILFLQALKLGLTILTRNVRDFDLLLQMRPEGRVVFYPT